ncbi:MAG: flagellar basal body P-ring formation chaperone FlgA [Caldimonas sp.]
MGSAIENISPNRAAKHPHFDACRALSGLTIATMNAARTTPSRWRLVHAVVLALSALLTLIFWSGPALAEDLPVGSAVVPNEAPPTGLDPALEHQVRALALADTAAAPAGVTRVEVVVGQLDPRLHLAPCGRVDPYLPPGTRLWGRARIGLRCSQGPSRWNVYLPITVKAYGQALVVPNGAASGSVLKADDLVLAEVDLAEDFTPAVSDPALAVGRTLAQSLKPGQSLRQAHLKVRQWFAAGDTVKVIARGSGFSMEGEGQAVSNGIEGQAARVRTESGRVVSGLPVGDRRIELTL